MNPIEKVNLVWSGKGTHDYTSEPKFNEQNGKPLMLSSLGSCSGITLFSLLEKMRLGFSGMKIEVIGEFSNNPPTPGSPFTKFNIKVDITSDEPKERYPRFARAAELTHTKHCGVSLMFSKIAPVDMTLTINGEEVDF